MLTLCVMDSRHPQHLLQLQRGVPLRYMDNVEAKITRVQPFVLLVLLAHTQMRSIRNVCNLENDGLSNLFLGSINNFCLMIAWTQLRLQGPWVVVRETLV